jgi:predicted nucleic acid-binding protein
VKIVADAYAWVELFSGTSKGGFAKRSMEEAETVITPDTVLAEVARKYLRGGVNEETIRQRLSTILEASEPSYVDDELAMEASKAYFELDKKAKNERLKKPSLFDALVLATGRKLRANVLTGDQHFEGLPETLWMGT